MLKGVCFKAVTLPLRIFRCFSLQGQIALILRVGRIDEPSAESWNLKSGDTASRFPGCALR